jgi:hypothetical protein
LTLVAGVGFIDAEKDQQIGQSPSESGVKRKIADNSQALPLSADLGRRRGSKAFRCLDSQQKSRWPAIRLLNLNATIIPRREVALWPRPLNDIFFFSGLLRFIRSVEQAIAMFDVDDDVSGGQKKVLFATINSDAHVERLQATCRPLLSPV